MIEFPEYITEDECFIYVPKNNVEEIKEYKEFIPLSDLLEDSAVTNAYYNVIGQIHGKNVVII